MDKLIVSIDTIAIGATIIAIISLAGIYITFARESTDTAGVWNRGQIIVLTIGFLLSATIVLLAFLVVWTLR